MVFYGGVCDARLLAEDVPTVGTKSHKSVDEDGVPIVVTETTESSVDADGNVVYTTNYLTEYQTEYYTTDDSAHQTSETSGNCLILLGIQRVQSNAASSFVVFGSRSAHGTV